MSVSTTVIHGGLLSENRPPQIDDRLITLSGSCESCTCSFSFSEEMLSHHTLLLGGIGMGKTNIINKMVETLLSRMNDDDVVIIFDTKGDFYRTFVDKVDAVLANSTAYRNVASIWNIFSEILIDGWQYSAYEPRAREIAASLFEGRGSTTQPFFVNAARDIFAGILICLIRKVAPARDTSNLTNAELVRFIRKLGKEDSLQSLFRGHADMAYLLTYLGDDPNSQSMGVLSELYNMVNEFFQGAFADQSDAPFSIQAFVRERGAKTLMIEYDLSVGQTIAPIYKLLIDLALKEAMGRMEGRSGNVYVILDELKLLPKLFHIEDALNFGRSYGVKVIAGLQSIHQLHDVYGEEKGRVLAAGFTNLIALHTNDYESRRFVSERLGTNFISLRYTDNAGRAYERDREGHIVEEWDLNYLTKGDAVVALLDENPFFFHFDFYPMNGGKHFE